MTRFVRVRPHGVVALSGLLLVLGCGGSEIGPNEPPPFDRSTPNAAIRALEDTFSFREVDAALAILAPEYRFFPVRPADIPFLEAGATSWDLGQERAILELLLVEERSTWIDQVLLEVHKREQRDLGNGRIEYVARVELALLIGVDRFDKAESEMVYVLQLGSDGQYQIVEERESESLQAGAKPVGQLRAESLEDRGVR